MRSDCFVITRTDAFKPDLKLPIGEDTKVQKCFDEARKNSYPYVGIKDRSHCWVSKVPRALLIDNSKCLR